MLRALSLTHCTDKRLLLLELSLPMLAGDIHAAPIRRLATGGGSSEYKKIRAINVRMLPHMFPFDNPFRNRRSSSVFICRSSPNCVPIHSHEPFLSVLGDTV